MTMNSRLELEALLRNQLLALWVQKFYKMKVKNKSDKTFRTQIAAHAMCVLVYKNALTDGKTIIIVNQMFFHFFCFCGVVI